jgi:predicted Fe-Mo cluster-binding NifX family protein
MRIAIPVWNDHVSPIFDVARQIRIYDVEDGSVRQTSVAEMPAGHHAGALREHGVDLLICAAVSSQLEPLIWVSGIDVVSDVCGPADAIARAFAAGDSSLSRYRSPGNIRNRATRSQDEATTTPLHRERSRP